MGISKKIILLIIFFVIFCVSPRPTLALKYELIPPTGELTRGQNIQFTINIDTEGAVVTSTQIGMTYNTQYLEYVSTVPGSTMNSVAVDSSLGAGQLLFTGTNATGFTGSGVFAQITFKLIAASPGSTELCVLWAPSTTPTPQPTSLTPTPILSCNSACTVSSQCPSGMTCYSGYCRVVSCPDQTSCVCPLPTALPRTGDENPKNYVSIIGGIVLLGAVGVLFYLKQSSLSHKSHRSNKHHRG